MMRAPYVRLPAIRMRNTYVQSRVGKTHHPPAHVTLREFVGPAGLLEAVWSNAPCAPNGSEPPTIAVICHPHSLHGGNLNNKITHTLARSFCELGAQSVRFNFRGAGRSEGRYDGGLGETEDLLAVIRDVRAQHPDCALWLAGFSFGAYVALRAAQHVNADRLITIAPPVNLYDFGDLAAPDCPWLLIQGTDDEVVPARDVARWACRLCPAPESVFLDGVDHYFHGKLNLLHSLSAPTPASSAPHVWPPFKG